MVEMSEKFLNAENDRLDSLERQLLEQRTHLDRQIGQIQQARKALNQYWQILNNQPVIQSNRGRRSGRRDQIYRMIQQHPDGATRAELIHELDVYGDRREEQSISNALSALKRNQQIVLRDGRYQVRSPELTPPK